MKKKIERRISAMISKKYSKENRIRFVKRLKRERMMLFTFLQTGTDYHNNTAERAMRPKYESTFTPRSTKLNQKI